MKLIEMLRRFAALPPATEESQQIAGQLAGQTFAIQALLRFSSFEVRVLSACTLARLDPSSAETILPTLIEGLQADEESHKVYAAYACRSLGPLAAPAVPTLTKLLEDNNEVVVHHVTQRWEPSALPRHPQHRPS